MDGRTTVVILMLPYRSHYTASFNYAFHLVQQNKRVVYAGAEHLRNLIADQGFDFHNLTYLLEYKIQSVKTFLGFIVRSFADPTFKIQNYRQFYYSYLEIKKLIDTYHPTEVYIDEGFSEYYWFFRGFNVSIKMLNPNLSTRKVTGVPPLNSSHMPKGTWWSDIVCEALWLINYAKLKSRDFISRISFLGSDEIRFWKHFCSKRGWSWKENIEWNHSFYRCMKNIETIILAPQKLEFRRGETIKNETYFHNSYVRNESPHFTDAYLSFMSSLEPRFSDPKFRLIYCTFGTQSKLNKGREIVFLRKLMECVKNEQNIFLVISDSDPDHQKYNSANIRIFSFLPHLHFLPYTDVVISHGGLGTIKECVDISIPMIIYPLNLKTDNLSNANRIQALGLGLAGNMASATPDSIRQNIYAVIHDKRFMHLKHVPIPQVSAYNSVTHAPV